QHPGNVDALPSLPELGDGSRIGWCSRPPPLVRRVGLQHPAPPSARRPTDLVSRLPVSRGRLLKLLPGGAALAGRGQSIPGALRRPSRSSGVLSARDPAAVRLDVLVAPL